MCLLICSETHGTLIVAKKVECNAKYLYSGYYTDAASFWPWFKNDELKNRQFTSITFNTKPRQQIINTLNSQGKQINQQAN